MKRDFEHQPREQACRGCGQTVLNVTTTPPGSVLVPVDPTPVPIGARRTGPWFERRGDVLRERGSGIHPPTPRGYPIHAVHHCSPPALCPWCQQIHHEKENVA